MFSAPLPSAPMPYGLALLLLLATCAPAPEPTATPPPSSGPPSEAQPADTLAAPTITSFQTGDGALLTVTFRSEAGVPLSDTAPLVLVIEGKEVEAPLDAGPARFSDPDGTIVDQAGYRLHADGFRLLATARHDAVTVRLSDGTAYRAYPYVSGDLTE